MPYSEVLFFVEESADGGYLAHAPTCSIFAQAGTSDELKEMVCQEVRSRFDDGSKPSMVRLRLSQDDILFFLSGPERSWKMARQPEQLSHEGKELALAYFNHVETQVSLAATTAYLTLVADTILINAYVTVFKDSELSRRLVWSAGGFLCLATLCALIAVIPHMRKKSGTVFYFRTVAAMADGDYLRDFTLHDRNATLHAELLKQVQGKCRHLRWMFWVVRAAIFFTVMGTLLLVIALASTHTPARPGDRQPTSQRSAVRVIP